MIRTQALFSSVVVVKDIDPTTASGTCRAERQSHTKHCRFPYSKYSEVLHSRFCYLYRIAPRCCKIRSHFVAHSAVRRLSTTWAASSEGLCFFT